MGMVVTEGQRLSACTGLAIRFVCTVRKLVSLTGYIPQIIQDYNSNSNTDQVNCVLLVSAVVANMKLFQSLALLAQISATLGADTNAWKSRTIYFALTDRIARNENDGGGGGCNNYGDYCGGTFKGLQGKLDYIKGMGFDAIWISPVVASMHYLVTP